MNEIINAVYLEGFGLSWKKKLKSNAVPTIMPKPHELQANKHKRTSNAKEKRDRLKVSKNYRLIFLKMIYCFNF